MVECRERPAEPRGRIADVAQVIRATHLAADLGKGGANVEDFPVDYSTRVSTGYPVLYCSTVLYVRIIITV